MFKSYGESWRLGVQTPQRRHQKDHRRPTRQAKKTQVSMKDPTLTLHGGIFRASDGPANTRRRLEEVKTPMQNACIERSEATSDDSDRERLSSQAGAVQRIGRSDV